MTVPAEGPKLGDVVSAAGLALGLLTAWLYLAGWSYAYHYLDRFRIPLLLSGLPREQLFVYGGLVIWKNLMASVFAGLGVLLAVAVMVRFRARLQRFGVTVLLVVLVIALFSLARIGGTATAGADFEAQRLSDYAAYPRVRLLPKASASVANAPLAALADIPSTDCARLVLATPERLFLIRPIRSAPGAELATFMVPSGEVSALRITGDYTSCE